MRSPHIVNDVTGLNPTEVMAVICPRDAEQVSRALRMTTGPVSVGGGRFSMGGQIASPGSVHLDMRQMNRILAFSPAEKTITVEPGVRWCDIQRFVDPHDLAVKVMQTYANFTVGGALSVNCHGRYVGLGPMVLSVRSVKLALHDGSIVNASRRENPHLFAGVAGGYGALGVIVEIELDLADNVRVKRVDRVMSLAKYGEYFRSQVRNDPRAVFHNADLYAPHYSSLRAVTWVQTDDKVTVTRRLQRPRRWYPLHQYFLWAMSETPFGKERRERFIDPLFYLRRKVHWRNYEAGYDVAELEPPSREKRTYVLQEYFVPVERLEEFVARMGDVLRRHRVNALNISIRHAHADQLTLMSWAPVESFALVLYYKQRTRDNAKSRVAVWTRELIDAVLSVNGRYYLPYQPHGTQAQFQAAYPGASTLFALKQEIDPGFRFTNVLWDKYYRPWLGKAPLETSPTASSEFHRVFEQQALADAFYRFLQNVFNIVPEDRLHQLIREACTLHAREEDVYRYIQLRMRTTKPLLADLTHALPSLLKQKLEMTRQVIAVLGSQRSFEGYLEIGSRGRYYRGLNKGLALSGPLFLMEQTPTSFSLPDMLERGQIARLAGREIPLNAYAPISRERMPDESVELVICLIGLHHMTPEQRAPFLASIHRVLKPGGRFVLRDHDVLDEDKRCLVSLAHTVFNAGLGERWESNAGELRHFEPVNTWVDLIAEAGFDDTGRRLLQAGDPTDNTLLCFVKRAVA